MGSLHDITIRLVDMRLKALQKKLSDHSGISLHLDSCLHLQREFKLLLESGAFRPEYAEGLLLFNNCQSIVESMLEQNMVSEALETFETECLLLTHSGLGEDNPSRIAARIAENVVRVFLSLPPTGAADQFRPFVDAALNAVPDPTVFSDALTQAQEKYTGGDNSGTAE